MKVCAKIHMDDHECDVMNVKMKTTRCRVRGLESIYPMTSIGILSVSTGAIMGDLGAEPTD
jgi:hypothetical protein